MPPEKRFESIVSDTQMALMAKGVVRPNTKQKTDWAMSCFREWRSARNKGEDKHRCPEDLLENPDVDKLNYWIMRFVVEVYTQ